MTRAYVSMGSNIDPETNIRLAVHRFRQEQDLSLRSISTVYRTEPLGRAGQPPYYNCVVEIETAIPPLDLKFRVLRGIEAALGRVRTDDKYAARTIDLDLIVYDDLAIAAEGLTLPDPDILLRPFLAIPLQELAPDLILPGSKISINEAAAAMPRDSMTPLDGFTDLLRKDIAHGRTE